MAHIDDHLKTLREAHQEIQRLSHAVEARRAYLNLMKRVSTTEPERGDTAMLILVGQLLRWRAVRNETVQLLAKSDADTDTDTP